MELLNKTAVKRFVREQKVKLGRDVIAKLELHVEEVLNKSAQRARSNQRKTLLGRDL
ncbi:hypothetical protein J4219_07715 [Candidatus Woesearchaeota archaeon]|nr:hypothetical protein [Candidatus Woesearchaeota archaeon]